MASSSCTWLMSLKVVLISTGVLSIALVLKFSLPSILNFVLHELPLIWSSLRCWLRPPYLYFVINGIIITIAASSRFFYKMDQDQNNQSEPFVSAPTHPRSSDLRSGFAATSAHSELRALKPPVVRESEIEARAPVHEPPSPLLVYESEIVDTVVEPPVVYETIATVVEPPIVYESETEDTVMEMASKPAATIASDFAGDEDEEDEDLVAVSKSMIVTPPKTIDSPEIPPLYSFPAAEKPLISARFGHRKPLKQIYEGGRGLRVAKPKKQETLESTWRMITEGRHVPLTRHLKKCETWENHGRQIQTQNATADTADGQYQSITTPPHQYVVKSETFRDRTNYDPVVTSVSQSPAGGGGTGKIRMEASLSQDELNRRVEAFIKKFNEEMRLQRQESLNQYMEMINRGSHY